MTSSIFARRAGRVTLTAWLGLAFAGVARALPPQPPPVPDWEFEAFFYGWASAVSADVKAGDVSTSTDISFFDLLKDLGWAFEGGTQLRYKRVLLSVDSIGVQVADNVNFGTVTRPFNLGGPLGPGGDLTVGNGKVSARATIWIIDPRLGFRALSLPLSKLFKSLPTEDPRRLDIDLLAGVRYWNVRNKLSVRVSPATLTVGGTSIDLGNVDLPDLRHGKTRLPGFLLRGVDGKHFNQHDDWTDPMIGLRIRGDVTEHISLFAIGDIGGFSAWSSASDLTWQGMLGARWHFAKHWSVVGGYRALGVQRPGALDNAVLYGPLIGAVFNL
jgi:hypothetical protein